MVPEEDSKPRPTDYKSEHHRVVLGPWLSKMSVERVLALHHGGH
jgi:hypothetical protein